MSDLFDSNAFVRAIGLALVYFVWQGAVIWALVAIALRVIRHPSARYIIASLGLLALVAAPIITAIRHYAGSAPLVLPAVPAGSGAVLQVEPATVASVAAGGQSALWVPLVVLLWSAGVSLLTIRLAANALAVHRLRRSAGVASPLWEARARAVASSLRVSRPFVVVESLWVDVPAVIGWLRPMILVPASTLAGLTPAMMDAILTHEIAHIRRHDYLVNALQHAAETLLFYHPAIWWVSNQMRVERELCCDDVAVRACGDRAGYARALLSLEELRAGRQAFALGAASGDLLSRVRHALGRRESAASPVVFLTAVSAIGIVLAIAVNGTNVVGAEIGLSSHAGASVEQQRDAAAVRAEIVRLEAALQAAIGTRDAGTLDRLLSATFVAIGPDGNPEAKAATIGRLLTLPPTIERTNWDVRAIPDAAIVTGTETQTTGTLTTLRRVTRVWNREFDGAWRVTSITTTDVRPPAPARNSATPSPRRPGELVEGLSAVNERLIVRGERPAAEPAPSPSQDGGDASTREPEPLRVGTGVAEPRRINRVAPVYPPEAKAKGIQGIVIADATINADGTVRDVVILRSIPLLDAAAADAIRQWRYTPPGIPLRMTVTVNFSLRDQSAVQPGEGSPRAPATDPTAPRVVSRVNPRYTAEALHAKVEGTIVVEVTVGTDGTVSEARVVRSIPMLDESALVAVRQWRFQPVDVPVTTTVEFDFRVR